MFKIIFALIFSFFSQTPSAQCMENDILSQLESYNQRCHQLLEKGNLPSLSRESAEILPFIQQYSIYLFNLKDKKESILFESLAWSVFSKTNLPQILDIINRFGRLSFEHDSEKSLFLHTLTALKFCKGLHADNLDEVAPLLESLEITLSPELTETSSFFNTFLEKKANFQEIYNRFLSYAKNGITPISSSPSNFIEPKKSYTSQFVRSDSFRQIETVINSFLTSSLHTGIPKIIVSFDFDDTLLTRLNRLELHRDYYSELKEKAPHFIDESMKNVSKIVKKALSFLQDCYVVKKEETIIDPLAKDLISTCHQCNISTMILTARQTYIHNITMESLFQNSLTLISPHSNNALAPSPQYLYDLETEDQLYGGKKAGPLFQDNIIYTCFELKGPHIKNFFKKTNNFPDLFVHIDDNSEQCKSVLSHMSRHCHTAVIHYDYTKNLLFKNSDDIIHYLRNHIDHDSIETVINRMSPTPQ